MWDLRNKTPFAVHGSALRDHTGASFWSVWIASTFALRPDRAPLFVLPQAPVALEPLFAGDDPEGVLLRDGETTPPRALIDLTVAAAALETLSEDRAVTLRLGGWQKRLTVRADREERGPVALDGTTAALSDTAPLGRAPDGAVPPRVMATGDGVPGFGPVARHWPARARLGGTYDAAWQRSRAPLLPADLDPVYWQAAPADQRLARPLPEEATLEVTGLAVAGPGPGDAAPARFPLPWFTLRTSTLIAGAWHRAEASLQSIHLDLGAEADGAASGGLARLVHQAVWPIARASDDVTIARSLIALDDAGGFRVRPAEAHLFDRATSLKEASP